MPTAHYLYKIQPTRPAMLTEGTTPREEEIISQHYQLRDRDF